MIESTTLEELLGFPLTEEQGKNAPDRLYYKGHPEIFKLGPRVSVVGTRKASPAGMAQAAEIARRLVEEGFVVVSGLARGIDTAAHRAAIEAGGSTIAVLGTPVDQYSTAANRHLQETIGLNHLLVSQFAPGSRVGRGNFPRRNLTMALLSDATIIVEISGSSGTKHQGWEAIRLGRIVMLCQSVIEEESTSWPKEMIEYGAIPLGQELDLQQVLSELPI